MSQPQPGPNRPADGSTPDQDHGRNPAVTEEPSASPAAPAPAGGTGPGGTRELPTHDPGPAGTTGAPQDTADTAPQDTADAGPQNSAGTGPQEAGDTGAGSTRNAGSGHVAGTGPEGTRLLPDDGPPAVGPQGTRMFSADEQAAEPPAPRWSGSAAVPPPKPRKRAWGETAENPPAPVPAPAQPEHQTPVDPWAGADTGGWDLPPTEPPPPTPTLPYPVPPSPRPYSGPPAPPVHSPAPPRPDPGRVGYPAASPAVAYPVSPPPVAYPVSPPPASRAPVPARPAAPPPPPPPQPAPPRQRRATAPPAGPPPGHQAPKGYAPKPTRKRRRWPWMLLLMLACCCGCPAYYGVPMASQYPADASLPAEVADLRLRDDNTSKATAKQLEAEVRKAHWLAEDTFAGVYSTPAGKRVTVLGGTGFRFTPESDAEDEITRLTGQYSLGEAQTIDTGVRGRHQRCAVGRADGQDVVVCTSVDHGSIATAVFTRLSLDDSATLLGTLRAQMITTDQK